MARKLSKLTRANMGTFFDRLAINAPFTASMSFEYAEVQEVATMAGVACRFPTWEEIAIFFDLEDSALRGDRELARKLIGKHRLFMVITREEYIENAARNARAMSEAERNWALDSVDTWFEATIQTLTWAMDDIKRRHKAFKQARGAETITDTNRHLGYHATSNMEAVIGRIRNLVNNVRFEEVIALTKDLKDRLKDEEFKNPYFNN